MNQKKIINITLLVLVLLALFMFFDNKNGLNGKSVSPNILYITQPVTTFSGTVDKIEGNKITIKQNQTLVQNIVPLTALNTPLTPIPTPKTVSLVYQVVVSNKTQITQPASYVNYLFKTVNALPTMNKLVLKDIQIGQYITVNSQVDLRTLASTTFEAVMINLPQKMNALSGKIIQLKGDSITIKAFTPVTTAPLATAIQTPASTPQEKEYQIALTSDTEISRTMFDTRMPEIVSKEPLAAPKSEKLTLSDLKKDMQITVYTDADVTKGTEFTALRIEPMIVVAAPLLPVVIPTP